MQLIFEQIRAGGDRNFGYLLGDRDAGQGVLIDPSYSPEAFVQRASDQGLTVTHVINTHGHPDHTNGNAKAAELTATPVAAFADSSLVLSSGSCARSVAMTSSWSMVATYQHHSGGRPPCQRDLYRTMFRPSWCL